MGRITIKSTNSLSSLLLTSSFALPYSCVTTSSILLSYYVEKVTYENSASLVPFVYPSLWVNILSYTAFFSVVVFCSSSRICASVAQGNCPYISIDRLKSLRFPFSLICGTEGERSLVKFVVQTLFFPGLCVLLVLHLLSFVFSSSASSWNLPFDLFLASNSLWRLIISSSIFVLNFFCALNPTQSCISECLKDA